jgi:hypothetical protein
LAGGIEQDERVPTQTACVAGAEVRIAPTGNKGWEWSEADISLDVAASSTEDAIVAATEPIEAVIESLSFQLQSPLEIESMTIVDADAGDAGEAAEFEQFTPGRPLPVRRFRLAPTQLGDAETSFVPDLEFSLPLDARHRAALDWYLKALASRYEVDRFIFLWIAMEILWRRSVTDRQAYDRRGTRIQAFLTARFDVPKGVAKRMWKARQVMHGDVPFDSAIMDELGGYTLALRVGVNNALKAAMGLGEEDPPSVGPPVLSVGSVALKGMTVSDAEHKSGASGIGAEPSGDR